MKYATSVSKTDISSRGVLLFLAALLLLSAGGTAPAQAPKAEKLTGGELRSLLPEELTHLSLQGIAPEENSPRLDASYLLEPGRTPVEVQIGYGAAGDELHERYRGLSTDHPALIYRAGGSSLSVKRFDATSRVVYGRLGSLVAAVVFRDLGDDASFEDIEPAVKEWFNALTPQRVTKWKLSHRGYLQDTHPMLSLFPAGLDRYSVSELELDEEALSAYAEYESSSAGRTVNLALAAGTDAEERYRKFRSELTGAAPDTRRIELHGEAFHLARTDSELLAFRRTEPFFVLIGTENLQATERLEPLTAELAGFLEASRLFRRMKEWRKPDGFVEGEPGPAGTLR